MKKVSLIALLVIAGFLSKVSAQYNPKASYDGPYKLNTWAVSAHIGPSQFYGDLREYDFWPVTLQNFDSQSEAGTLNFGVTVHKQLSHLFGARLDFNTGNLRGMKRRIYFSYFRGNYSQLDLSGTVNLKSLLLGPNKMKRWKADVSVGVGQMFYSAKAYELGTGRLQRSVSSTNDWVIPIGFEVSYELNKNIDLGLEFRANHVNTEKLDATIGGDASSIYNGGGNLIGNGGSVPRGTSSLDMWGYGGIVLTYKLGKNKAQVTKKDGKWSYAPDAGNVYHLRYTDPKLLVKPPKILTLAEMDSVAKANRPKDIDPKLLIDTDGDGVADFFDKEPTTPAGSVVSGAGQKIDFDKYIASAMPNGDFNCTEIFANVLFDTDKNELRPEYQDMLSKVVELLNKSKCRLQLAGHADRRSNDRYNMGLSQRRVDMVKNYLISAGLKDANKIIIDYYGSFKPIADNMTKDGLKKNRRVELKLMP